MIRPEYFRRAEWALAIVLTGASLLLLVVRVTHAGPLWRDECAVVNLARMPTIADIARNFQHEAFPVPFPIFVRVYTSVFGTSDVALRVFGLLAGIAVIAALWLSSFLIFRRVPVLSVALLGLNATLLVWGTTLRGYGLGSALIILAFGSFIALLVKFSVTRAVVCAVISIAAVQCLVHNLALVCVLGGAAAIICIGRHDFRRLIVFLGIVGVCIASFLPYLSAYSSSWSEIVEFPVTFGLIWRQFNFALGNPNPAIAWLWHIAFVVVFAIAGWQLWRSRKQSSAEHMVLAFIFISAIAGLIVYYEFLQTLSYLTRSWYFLALLSFLAVAIDSAAAMLSDKIPICVGRLALALIALVMLPINAWPKILERQTNIDIVAEQIARSARSDDLIVIAPWQYGISFQRYYRGPTPSITLPFISDLRVHRYDLFRDKMASPNPIDDVLEKIRLTLAGGNRVWLVGGVKLPQQGQAPRVLPPLSGSSGGGDNVAYSEAWRAQLGIFVREHGQHGETVSLPSTAVISQFENVPLVEVDGWH